MRKLRTKLTFTDHGGARPYVGLYLLASTRRTAFMVESVRKIKRRTPGPDKYALGVLRVSPEEAAAGEPVIMRWDPRRPVERTSRRRDTIIS